MPTARQRLKQAAKCRRVVRSRLQLRQATSVDQMVKDDIEHKRAVVLRTRLARLESESCALAGRCRTFCDQLTHLIDAPNISEAAE